MQQVDRDNTAAAPPPITLAALFLKFLRFGALAFGGPVAQIAMVREALVEREGWITPARFNRLLAVMQALPGPEAHELCVHMGMIARGRIGGLLAGLGFMLPGLLLMLACAAAYTAFAGTSALFAAVLLGAQIAVLAVIVRAVWRIGRHVCSDALLWAIAGAAALANLAGVPFWLLLVAGGAAGAVRQRAAQGAILLAVIAAGVLALTGHLWAEAPAALSTAATTATLPALFLAGLKGGLLTFGGAYTAIPYVRADTVERGWLGDGAFLDGVAIANLLPAPLVIFATFTGYVAGGLSGALAVTAGMFLPAFAFSLIFFERLEALVEHPRLARLLDAVAAAAVGIIGATLVQLAFAAMPRIAGHVPAAAAILAAAMAATLALRQSWAAPAIIAGGGLAGALAFG